MTRPSVVDLLKSGQIEFLDAGSGVGGSFEHVVKRFGATNGLGLEISPDDVAAACASGWNVLLSDVVLQELPERSVSFVSVMDFLEHLEDVETSHGVLAKLGRAARDFLFIRHPSFEDITYLSNLGLKITWTDWADHPSMFRIADYRHWFANLGWNDYVIHPRGPIRDSWNHVVLPINASRDAQEYDPHEHGPKEFVVFDRPVYSQYDIIVRLNPGMDADRWRVVSAPDPEPSDATPGDGVGVYDPATAMWYVRPDVVTGLHRFSFGPPGTTWVPIVGDWTGSGTTGPGLYDPEIGIFFLKNEMTDGAADAEVSFGAPGGIPVVGDWTGSGRDSVGLFYPETGVWFLKTDAADSGQFPHFSFGAPDSGLVPIAGDWDGDGVDSVGLYDPSSAQWHLLEELRTGAQESIVSFGHSEALPVAGDWDGDGRDTFGVYVPSEATFHLRNTNTYGTPDVTVRFGPDGLVPLTGRWRTRRK